MSRSREQLLAKLKTMADYVDANFEGISEAKAYKAVNLLDGIWKVIERRRS